MQPRHPVTGEPIDLVALIHEHGLEQFEKVIVAHSKPCVHLLHHAIDPEAITPFDSIRGGHVGFFADQADAQAHWPRFGEICLQPILTVNLEHAAPHDAAGLLPRRGRLTFWYDMQNRPRGFEVADRAGARVTFDPDPERLKPFPAPGPIMLPDVECEPTPTERVEFIPGITIQSVHDREPDLTVTEDPYWERLRALRYAIGQWNFLADEPPLRPEWLLGFPELPQSSNERCCELNEIGTEYFDVLYGRTVDPFASVRPLDQRAADWILLVQLDDIPDHPSDDGEPSVMHYYIRRQQLADRDFSRTWTMLQGH